MKITRRHSLPGKALLSKAHLLMLLVLGIGLSMLAVMMVPLGTAYAGGGVGGGGGGVSGCGQVGNWSCNGWGWALYQTSGSGPVDGFNTTSHWYDLPGSAGVQHICQNAGASQVFVFTVDDQYGGGMGYNYTASYDGPPQYAGHFTSGQQVDYNRGNNTFNATAEDTSAAYNAYGSLDPGLKAGYTWGSNVSWFCYNTNVTISGLVYYYNGAGSIGLAGVGATTTCGSPANPVPAQTTHAPASGDATDSSGGTYSFNLKTQQPFCIRMPDPYIAPDGTSYGGLRITPNHILNGANDTYTGNCGGNTGSYEFQYSGSSSSGTVQCNYGIGNGGYNFAYTTRTPAPVKVQLHVYEVDSSGNFIKNISGASVVTCSTPATISTGSDGFGYLTTTRGAGFCLRTSGGNVDTGSNGPFVRPWGEGYNGCSAYGGPPYSGYCNQGSYECQVAGEYDTTNYPGGCQYASYDRAWDGGFDFVYIAPPSVTNPCPNWQAQGNEPVGFPTNINVTINNTNMPASPDGSPTGAGGQSGSTTTPNQHYYQYTPQSKFRIDSAQDQYSPPTGISTTAAIGTWQSSSNFTLDYSNYYKQYPYDPHNTTIGYTQDWTQAYWYTSSSPDFYTCRPNDSTGYNGNTSVCYYSASSSFSTNCPSGWTYYSAGGLGPGTPAGCWQQQGPGGSCGFTQAELAPYNGVGWCYGGAANPPTYPTPACWPGSPSDSGPDANGYCYYPATAHYNWHQGGTSTVTNTGIYSSAPAMPACYDRTFTVNSVVVSANLDDAEDPTTGTVQGSANVTFGYPANGPQNVGLRNPMKVNLSYNRTITGCDSGINSSVGNGATIIGAYQPSTVSGPLDNPAFSCAFMAPPHVAGDSICGTYTASPTGTTIDWQGNVTSNNGASATNSPAPTCSTPLTNMPYAHFMGADVSAGGAFASGNDACAGENSIATATISAFVKGSGALTRGSGTQFAALANGSISTFGSAILRASGNYPVAQNGLSFANSSATPGNLGVPMCEPDFFSSNTATATTLTSGSTISISSLDTSSTSGTAQQGYFTPPPGFTGTAQYNVSGFNGLGQGISDGNRIAVYVNGDVYIQNDIKFKNTTWSTVANIPSFYLVVKGNIYISPSVHQLDGVYVAEPNGGSGGTINTCAPGFSAYTASNLFNNCQSQLDVNGAFVANNVKLYRTYASLRNSLGGEYPTGASSPDDCTAGDKGTINRAAAANTYDCGAEVFNLTPDILLGQPAIGANATPDDGKFDFITSLSPVL